MPNDHQHLVVAIVCAEEAMSFTGYGNIQLKISQPSVFNVPPECKGPNPLDSEKVLTIMTKEGDGKNKGMSQERIFMSLKIMQ